jgi:Mrp family chromosome partitioning ATPase
MSNMRPLDTAIRHTTHAPERIPAKPIGVHPVPPEISRMRVFDNSSLLAAIRSLLAERGSLILHVIAAAPREGVSTLSRALAFEATGLADVLLIDANPGPESQQKIFRAEQTPELWSQTQEPGPVRTLLLTVDSRPTCHFAVMQFGTRQDGPRHDPTLLPALYDRLRRSFSLVIVDGPSAMESADYVFACEKCDGVLLVVAAESTRVPVVQRAKRALEEAGARILGVIMNKRKQYIPERIYQRL